MLSPKGRFATRWSILIVCLALICSGAALAQEQPSAGSSGPSCAEMEEFLRTARVGAMRNVPKGVTLPRRATLDNGKLKHDAAIQTIDEKRTSYQTARGTELNFRDYWGYNIAGYELAKILELNMVPPYVARNHGGKWASFSWWIDVMMDEVDRMRRKADPPDLDTWNKEMYVVRVFNQLIYNMDDNLTNFLITPDWHIWMIDFSRAFRTHKTLLNPKNLVQCDRKLLAKLRQLDTKMLEEKLVTPKYLTKMELDGLSARAQKIVQFFDEEIARKGEAAVLFDLPRVGQPCGVGIPSASSTGSNRSMNDEPTKKANGNKPIPAKSGT